MIVDQVTLSGLAVDLARYKDGRTNFDDLLGEKKPDEAGAEGRGAGRPAARDRHRRHLAPQREHRLARRVGRHRRAALERQPEDRPHRERRPRQARSSTARIEGRQPQVALQVNLDTGYRVELRDPRPAVLSSFDLKAAGDAPGLAGLDARLKGDTVDYDPQVGRIDLAGIDLAAKSKDGLDAKLSIPKLQLAPDRAESKAITGAVKLVKPQQTIDAKLALSALEAKGKQIQFSRFDVDLSPRDIKPIAKEYERKKEIRN